MKITKAIHGKEFAFFYDHEEWGYVLKDRQAGDYIIILENEMNSFKDVLEFILFDVMPEEMKNKLEVK
jgi:hypothetical protein